MSSTTPYFIDAASKKGALVSSPPLEGKHNTDILIVGGGMAGIAAASSLADLLPQDTFLTLVESAYALGVTTMGKSGGFIADHLDDDYYDTNSSVSLQLRKGIEGIARATRTHGFPCDLREIPSIYVARRPEHLEAIVNEYHARKRDNFDVKLLERDKSVGHIGFDQSYGAMVHQGTRHLDPLAFVSGLARSLREQGRLQVYTSTPVISLDTKRKIAKTPKGEIHYGTALITAGGGGPDLGMLKNKVFFWRDVIAVTQPLDDAQRQTLFPSGNPYLFWDSDENYIYGAPLADGSILFGGETDLSKVVTLQEYKNQPPLDKQELHRALHVLLQNAFPGLAAHQPPFSHLWSGIIPMSVDSLPFTGEINDGHFVALYNQNLPAAFRGGDLMGAYIATHQAPEELGLFHYDRKTSFSHRIRSLTQRQPFAALANLL